MKLYWTTFVIAVLTLFSACEKEENASASFELQETDGTYLPSGQGGHETFNLRASGDWQVEPLYDVSWVTVEPMSGSGDGTITVTVDRNATTEERREVLMFLVNGRRQNNILDITQAPGSNNNNGNGQYVHIEGIDGETILLSNEGISGRFTLRATGNWRVELSDQTAEWLRVEPMAGTGDTPILLSVDPNLDDERTVDLGFYLNDVRQEKTLKLVQEGFEEVIILEEDFNWLQYGSAIFYTTTGETRMDRWTADELARGWGYYQLDPTGVPSTYARQGFLKLGRTNYGGDILSPKLSTIQGTQNVKVTFKAVPYKTAGGAEDVTLLKVGVVGPGSVSVDEFNINNWPDYDLDPNCTIIWTEERTVRSFTIEGATAETQIWFLGGDYDLRSESGWLGARNVNRIFLDDILVTVVK